MALMFSRVLTVAFGLLISVVPNLSAHEFWIEPVDHFLATGDTLEANLKVGQNYSGSTFPFLPERLVQFSITGPTGTRDVTGTVGDMPAGQLADLPDGLHVMAYESTTDKLTFSKWEKFKSYVTYEGNDWAVAAHLAADLPKTGFTEAYRRYAKSLVQVGPDSVGGSDRQIGLAIEFVALGSPYALASGQTELPVQLMWQGAPLAQQRINVFHLAETVSLSELTTDQNGTALVPIAARGRYLLNSVHMELNTLDPAIAWNSYWASLTFQIGTSN